MQWFGAVKPDMPYTTSGVTGSYPSAGPYYIQSRDVGRSLVEARNPYYKGPRPANPDKIVWTMNTDQDQSLLQVKAGQADVDAGAPPPTANASLAQQYGVNKSRFFVGAVVVRPLLGAEHDTRRRSTTLAARKAVNWAHRPSGDGPPVRLPRRASAPTRSWFRACRGTSRTASTPSAGPTRRWRRRSTRHWPARRP